MVKETAKTRKKGAPLKTVQKKTAARKAGATAVASKGKPKGLQAAKPQKSVKPSKPQKKAQAAKTVKPVKQEPASKTPVATAAKKKLSPRERVIRDNIRKKLLRQRNALLSEAEVALNALPGQTMFPDLGDQASAEIDRNFMLRLRGREQRLLKKIDEAIEKIESGAFGICEVCGQEIDIKRLDARPVTTMCIFCKTEQEEEEKARGA